MGSNGIKGTGSFFIFATCKPHGADPTGERIYCVGGGLLNDSDRLEIVEGKLSYTLGYVVSDKRDIGTGSCTKLN